MIALIVEFCIHAAHVDDFEVAITENARASRENEPGCKQFDVCRDPNDPQLFFLYELYDDDDAIQAHLQSAHFQAMNAASASWVASKQVRTYRRTAP